MTALRIDHLLTETISVRRVSGFSSGGDPTRATAVTMPARVQRVVSQGAPPAQGYDDVGGEIVFTTSELLVGDLVFLPEDDPTNLNTGRRVKNVTRHVALDGTVTHYTSGL